MAASSGSKATRPPYIETLDAVSLQRYNQKLEIIGGTDPYKLKSGELSSNPDYLPSIQYPHIVNYLVFNPSPYTVEDFMSFKGLEAYNQFVCGWVRDVSAAVINKKHVVVGKVMHSQRLRDTPLKPWIIAEKTGRILCGHCDCMAGLGETCTHVSALLFYVDTKVRIRDSQTVTQEPAYWKLPSAFKDITYSPVAELDFTSASTKKRRLDALVNENTDLTPVKAATTQGTKSTPGKKLSNRIAVPTETELHNLFKKLSEGGSKAAILSVVPGYSKQFKPSVLDNKYPKVLTDLYVPENVNLTFMHLIEMCQEIDISVTTEQAKCVEQATKDQSNCKLWFRFRAGRLTASKMKRVCKTNPDKPSISLIRDVCYPAANKFSNVATKWGCEHEETARKSYIEKMTDRHENFQVGTSGFVINTEFPHLGASPDGHISCDCCGTGVLEIKCPLCAKDSSIEDYCGSGLKTCLEQHDGMFKLRLDHQYMFQIQTQINVCEVDYADFVLWTNRDLHIERIECNQDMWLDIAAKSTEFFKKCVLPELVGKFYSKTNTLQNCAVDNANSSNDINCANSGPALFCYCKQPEDIDDMIACDNQNCDLTWYHIGCLKIKNIPKGKWFCPECRKGMKKQTKSSKK